MISLYIISIVFAMEKNVVILSDKTDKGVERPWKDKKVRSISLANSYKRLGLEKRYFRVKECGTFLEFKRFHDNSLKLNASNFCKDRLCPVCAWRRSLKIFGQTSKIMDKALEEQKYRFLFLTLTAKNVYGDDLSAELDQMFKGFKRFTERKQIKNSIVGWFRALEVTHNTNKLSKNFDTYHSHFHVILMVRDKYFKKKDLYLKQSDFTDIWKSCLGLDYTPIVHIEAFKNSKSKAVAEAAKYTVKDYDYLIDDDLDLTDSTVSVLSRALRNRRLVAFGGRLKEISKELKLDDVLDGDLVNTNNDDCDDIREDLNFIIERYKWNVGYSHYVKMN